MNVRFILIGLLFLINPNIAVIDILPDFIGAIFILKGISRLSFVDEKAKFARKSMLIFLWISVLKTLSVLSFTIIDASNMTWMLVFTFCFGLGETGLLLYFFSMLNKSLNYTAMINDAPEIFNRCESFTSLSCVFIVVRSLMSMLPELVYLFDIDYGDVVTISINWSFVTYMLMGVNVIIVTALGTVWYLNSWKFWKKVGKQSEYLAKIENKYNEEVGSNKALLTYNAFRTLSLMLIIAFVFLITLRLDGFDYLPTFVSGGIFIAAAIRIRKLYRRHSNRIIAVSSAFLLVAISEWILWYLFCTHYYTTQDASISFITKLEIYRGIDPDVDNNYMLLSLLTCLKALLCIMSVASFIPAIRDIVKEHTGAIPELRNEQTDRKTKQIHRVLNALTTVFILFAFITIVFDPVAVILCFDLPVLTVVSTLTGVAFLIYAWLFLGKLTEAIENKYMY